ncbi:MAG: hypothetical protein JWL62_1589 [Hyphomicrobiales bacterium]|nr:hypothetical protein [Hyphomicrobiales bacterium]
MGYEARSTIFRSGRKASHRGSRSTIYGDAGEPEHRRESFVVLSREIQFRLGNIVELFHLLGRQQYSEGIEIGFELVEASCADKGGTDARARPDPSQRNRGGTDAKLRGDLGHLLNDIVVCLAWNTTKPVRFVSISPWPLRLNFPLKKPLLSGDHGMTPIPIPRANGSSSPSLVRSSSEYSICSAMIGAQPRKCAMV